MPDPNPNKPDKGEAAKERAEDKAAREEARAKRKADREAAGLPPEPDEEDQPVVDNTLPGDLNKPTQQPS